MSRTHGMLSDYFDSFGYKKLSAVEVDPSASNEHEFNGVSALKSIFGNTRVEKIPCRALYLCDDEEQMSEELIQLTWYDARERHPTRSEFRLYYTDSICIAAANPDDLMILCRNHGVQGKAPPITMLIARAGDTITAQLCWLFGIAERQLSFRFSPRETSCTAGLDYYTARILERIGVVLQPRDDALLDLMRQRFANGFPQTREFSAFARELSSADALADPDGALSDWINTEDRAFRLFENFQLSAKIERGFNDVDEFVRFSLRVQNRRKARAGYALENHLRELLLRHRIVHAYNVVTEHRSRPDFIFPGLREYQDDTFPTPQLTMLGAKTTCKDRWRQVLSEAQRIPQKHLCTLEPGISIGQTEEMRSSQLQLVVPRDIVSSYSDVQQNWLMAIGDFIEMVRDRQRH
ncbi:MAG: restriction endonuclease [Deltaproteobacteria bacterium]|nr:restriction endonuclease [Deltaproteobacteria bacterium]